MVPASLPFPSPNLNHNDQNLGENSDQEGDLHLTRVWVRQGAG